MQGLQHAAKEDYRMNDGPVSPNSLRLLAKGILELADNQEQIGVPEELVENAHVRIREESWRVTLEKQSRRLASIARREHRKRLERQKYFESGILGEPVWDMMLDLFANHLEGKRVSITSLALASNIPGTTALRYIRILENREMIKRFDSNEDQRVTYVEMTEGWVRNMAQILTSWEGAWLLNEMETPHDKHLIVKT